MLASLKRQRPLVVAGASEFVQLAKAHDTKDTTIESATGDVHIDTLRLKFAAARDPETRGELWAELKRQVAARRADGSS